VIARYNGQAVLGLFNNVYSSIIEGTVIPIDPESALYYEYDQWDSDPQSEDESLLPFTYTEFEGGITDGKTKYYDMPPHWQMIATDDDTWAWPIGQIEIQDDPAYPSYVTEVWTSMNTKQIVEVIDRRYPDFSRVLIIEYAAVPDPFKDHWTVYLLNDKKSIDLKLSGTASIELRNLYQNAENGTAKTSNEIEENAVEYGTLILRNDTQYKELCYEFAGIRINGDTIWLYMADAESYVIIPQDTTAHAELMDIYHNDKLPQGVTLYH
jgi:hypothetical protein